MYRVVSYRTNTRFHTLESAKEFAGQKFDDLVPFVIAQWSKDLGRYEVVLESNQNVHVFIDAVALIQVRRRLASLTPASDDIVSKSKKND